MARDFAIPEKTKRWSLQKKLRKNQELWRTYEEWKPLLFNNRDGEALEAPVEDPPIVSSENNP